MKKFFWFILILSILVLAVFYIAKVFEANPQSITINPQNQLATVGATNSINASTKFDTMYVSDKSVDLDWYKSVTLEDGEMLSFQLHYRLADGKTNARDVKFFMDDLDGIVLDRDDSRNVSGRITSSNFANAYGNVDIRASERVQINFYNVSWQIYPCQSVKCDEPKPSGYRNIFSSGMNIGTVSGSDNHYTGNVLIEFTVESTSSDRSSDNYGNVESRSATDIDDDSAVLRGEVLDGRNLDVWFVLDDDDDIRCNDSLKHRLSGGYNSDDSFSKKVSGLEDNTRYYFRACGRDDDGDTDSGVVKSFRTEDDDSGGPSSSSRRPDADTFAPTNISAHFANLNGGYDGNGSDATVYFEYGRTHDLGKSTKTYERGSGSGEYQHDFTNLAANMTYYYRAVVMTDEGVARGDIEHFRTPSAGKIFTPPKTSTVKKTVIKKEEEEVVDDICIGYGTSPLRLDIRGNYDKGKSVRYDIQWENISDFDLEDASLIVRSPHGTRISAASSRQVLINDNEAIFEIKRIESGHRDDVSVYIDGSPDDGGMIVQATMVFENPNTGARENVTDYDSSGSYSSTGQSDGVSGLWIWIILLLLIIVLLLLIKWLFSELRRDDNPSQAQIDPDDVYIPYSPDRQ